MASLSFARSGVLLLLLLVSGCGGMKIEDFEGSEPRFLPERYFAGKTRAWGLFQDLFGTVRRQFVVDIDGTWDGTTLVLDERFVYSDGERERRVWTITRHADGTYEGKADGVVGVADGKAVGRAMNWRYDFDLKVGDGTWRVAFDDWMFLQDERVMINKATVRKWGVSIGEVSLFFQKLPDTASARAQAPLHQAYKAAE